MENDNEDNEEMEEEKYINDNSDSENRNEERTVSYYSMGSGPNRLSIFPREISDGPSDPKELNDLSPTHKPVYKSGILNRANTI